MTEPATDPAELVRVGWDRASRKYRPDQTGRDPLGPALEEYRNWLAPVFAHVPRGTAVLDLGCGCGVPTARLLAQRFRVTGIDVSTVQIERARRLVPSASFRRADMTAVDFPSGGFGAVVCLYALIHVPLPAQRPLLDRIRRWLAPGGWLVLIAGHEAFEGIEENWLGSGAPMYWSHADAATYRAWLLDAGFEIRDERFVPEGAGGHELFRAVARGAVRAVRTRPAARTAAGPRRTARSSRRPSAAASSR